MKKINKKYLAGICLFLLSACSLDELPQDTATNQSIFGSKNGLELYANSFYDNLPQDEGVFNLDDMSDIIAQSGVPGFLGKGMYSAINGSGWGLSDWKPLRNINYFIENCEKSTVVEKDHYLGLARFFRAYFYFNKVKRFGDVPWIDKTIDIDDEAKLYASRDKRDFVMDKVLEDLDFAIANITLTKDDSRTLITKDVARAYKTRICLYEASIRRYHTGYGLQSTADKWYQEVVKEAEAITGFSIYQGSGLDKSYRDLFIARQPILDETMLVVAYSSELQVFNSANRRYISPTFGNRPSLSRHFVHTYLNLDGTPFTDISGYETMEFQNEVENRDLRLKQTIRSGDYHRTENGVRVVAPPSFSISFTGYQPIKWCFDERFPYDDESRNDNCLILMRYAEVLLNLAEAKAELGTFTDADWARTIGTLRARAGITGGLTAKPTVADPYMVQFYNNKVTDPVILEIRRERAIEMIWESLRFDDLIRWRVGELSARAMTGIYVPALNVPMDLNEDGIPDVRFYQGDKPEPIVGVVDVDVSPGKQQTLSKGTYGELIWEAGVREWQDRKYLYPIPEAVRVRNPNLGQNEGWEL